ncbi:hypothetical protein [Vibrio phage PJN101]|nr:hypothetical protein [Vibrio phage PJN101]
MDKVINPKFMLLSRNHTFKSGNTVKHWLVISSADLGGWMDSYSINYYVTMGSCTTKSFGHSTTPPEDLVLRIGKTPLENHGYFRDLRDVNSYVKMEEMLNG